MSKPAPAPALLSQQLATAVSHSTRVRAMMTLFERVASPKEIAAEIGEPVNNVTYHVDQLVKLGCIELVRTDPVHGGRVVEHFYRATQRAMFDSDAWRQFGERERVGVTASTMGLVSGDISEAMTAGTFFSSDDNHISRSPMVVDPEGWDEVGALLDSTLEQLFAIQDRCGARRRETEGEDLRIKVEILQFRSPPLKRPKT